MSIVDQVYELVSAADLVPHPDNPRHGDVDSIAESVAHNGFYGALIVQRSTRRVLAGNHRLYAARQEGIEQLPVIWVDVDDDAARRILLVDNRSNDVATYDAGKLEALLAELNVTEHGLAGTGYSAADLAAGSVDIPTVLNDPDEAPDVPDVPVTALGDGWQLGPHRLVCGDAGDADVWERLLAYGDRPGCVWTDPPYGVGYVGKTKDSLTIANDTLDAEGLSAFLKRTLGALLAVCGPGTPWYVAGPPGPLMVTFGAALLDLGLYRQTLMWVKDSFVLGHSDYHYRHEPIFLGYGPPRTEGRAGRGGDRWYGTNNADSVLEFDRPKRSTIHPTMKPVDLIVACLANSAGPGEIVADPFAGSGSTLIACHDTGRIARLVELDPHYCDVICRRYQEHTGTMPISERTGSPHDFVTE